MNKVIEIAALLRFLALFYDYGRRVLILILRITRPLIEEARLCAINMPGKINKCSMIALI